ncbi:MAG TPA: T9SS type A sorting domain-containing protein [Bacteroidales bacterium]|nr:T9SS type A sorting domain-containing protein [Bacteroidales bacterium]
MRYLLILLLIFFSCLTAKAYNDGDYRNKASGDWNNYAIWQYYKGTTWRDTTVYPGQSGDITTSIYIQAGTYVYFRVNLTSSAGGSIVAEDNTTLLVLTPVYCYCNISFGNNAIFNINESFDMGSNNISGVGHIYLLAGKNFSTTGTVASDWMIIHGTFTTTNAVDVATYFYIYGDGYFKTSYNGTSGWWAGTPPSVASLGGPVEFNSTVNGQVVPGLTYTGDLYIKNSGIKNISGTIITQASCNIYSGSTLDLTGGTLDIQGYGLGIEGTLKGGTGSALNFDGVKTSNQTLSGAGAFSGTIGSVSIGSSTASNTTFSIDANYGTGLLETGSLSVASGSTFTINETSWVTATSVTVNATDGLVLKTQQSSSPRSASLLADAFSGSGTVKVDYYLPAAAWKYLSSPIDQSSTVPFETSPSDLAQYVESLTGFDQNNRWVATDGYRYGDGSMLGPGFHTFSLGSGYAYYYSSSKSASSSGSASNVGAGSVTVPLSYSNAQPNSANDGWNLLGNPYTCVLDWSVVDDYLGADVGKAVYFYNSSGGYSVWLNGNGTNGASNYIPPMQGFFVHTNNTATSVNFPTSAKTHWTIARYKDGTITPMVKLKLSGNQNSADAIVTFNSAATKGNDADYDAPVMGKTLGKMNIWSSSLNMDYSINGLPYPSQPGDTLNIPVSIYSGTSGNFSISASALTGLDLYAVTLTDKLNNYTVDLKTNPSVSFSASSGITPNRFILKISNILTPVPEVPGFKGAFKVYPTSGLLNIQLLDNKYSGDGYQVWIYDMSGRKMDEFNGIEFVRDDLRQIPVSLKPGLYIIRISSPKNNFSSKIIVKQ